MRSLPEGPSVARACLGVLVSTGKDCPAEVRVWESQGPVLRYARVC